MSRDKHDTPHDASFRVRPWRKRLRVLGPASLTALITALAAPAVAADEILDICQDELADVESRIAACSTLTDLSKISDEAYVTAHWERGLIYVETGDYRLAIQDFTTVILMESDDLDAWVARGEAKLAIDRPELARQDFRHVLRIDPENARAREVCADAVVAIGLEDQTTSAVEHACAIVTIDEEAYAAAVRKREEAAADDYVPAARRVPKEFGEEVLDTLDQLQAARDDREWFRAAELYSRALALDPVAVLCRWQLNEGLGGYVLRQYDMLLRPEAYDRGPIPRTLGELQVLLTVDPADPEALRERGLLFAESGAGFAAVDDLDAALRSDPDSIELLIMSTKARLDVLNDPKNQYRFPRMTRSYFKPDLILERIERAIELGSEDFMTHLTHAEVLGWQRGVSEKVEALRRRVDADDRAIALLPTWPDHPLKFFVAARLYMDRGAALLDLGDEEQSFEDFGRMAVPPGIAISDWYDACYVPDLPVAADPP
jgi:tetratricopeptide (TPR) repeat protein